MDKMLKHLVIKYRDIVYGCCEYNHQKCSFHLVKGDCEVNKHPLCPKSFTVLEQRVFP